MGLAESALILLGIGIVSSRFKAGVGLGELGTGISTLVAAPLVGTGTGLSVFSGGLRDLAETLGDLGRGFSALFESIPKIPGFGPGEGEGGGGGGARIGNGSSIVPKIWFATQPLIPDSGGNARTLLTGGGGSVPTNGVIAPPVINPSSPDLAAPLPPIDLSPIPPTGGSTRMRYYVL